MTSRGKVGKKSAIKASVTCDFDLCADYTPERMKALQFNRSRLGESDFSIFTSGIRLAIVLMLLKMESACVCEIQFVLNELRQPLVSHHLRTMKKAGWLVSEKWKKWTFYSLVPEKKDELMHLIKGYTQ
jgi:ArsR family transcriptional regulator